MVLGGHGPAMWRWLADLVLVDFWPFELPAGITGPIDDVVCWSCGGGAAVLSKRRLAVANHWN
ncbi:hypothetical protein HYPGJ_31909 [Hyphomicrobium sp. GJ21]|nr:hypothetical protein HYPGJ_31909 [Hyphomicrobium sp. GJ21]